MDSDISKPQKPTPEEDDPSATAPEPTEETQDVEVVEEPKDPEADDPKTDKAVEDIVKKEGDETLAAEDAVAESTVVMKQSRLERFKQQWIAWWVNPKKRWSTLGGLAALILLLLAIPYTRYNILGLALKGPVTVEVVDSKTGAPVSGATVELSGKTAETQANGKAQLRVNLGTGKLQVSKKYYTGSAQNKLVGFSHNSFKASLVATGRQVSIKVVNKLTSKPVAGVTVSASGANTKTTKDGTANLVLPSGDNTAKASLMLEGYNTLKVDVDTTGNVSKNTFAITPAGKLYFLSNLSGKIDVVKTDLDGTNRQTVLAGTGSEDRYSTSLLASRDWKYLALLSKRSGDTASVYLIDTTNGDKLTTVDQGNATFSLVGWSGSRFIYQVTRNNVSDWQANQQALKSLDATTGQTLLLDQTLGSGTNANDFVKQQFGSPYIIGNQVVYAKNWNANYLNSQISSKQAELDTIAADGTGHKTVKTFALASGTQTSFVGINTVLYEPSALYIQFSDGSQSSYYDYEDGKVTADTSLNDQTFYNTPYPTYLLSPSGSGTFWADQRDGKNTLFVGDQDAKNQKQVATLSPYNTYGWFTDDYLLVSKSSSELYIMPTSGGTPYKITDYYKPAINYNGYGGGYGGL